MQTLILMTSIFPQVLCFEGLGVLLRNLCQLQGHRHFLGMSRSFIVLAFTLIFTWDVS